MADTKLNYSSFPFYILNSHLFDLVSVKKIKQEGENCGLNLGQYLGKCADGLLCRPLITPSPRLVGKCVKRLHKVPIQGNITNLSQMFRRNNINPTFPTLGP